MPLSPHKTLDTHLKLKGDFVGKPMSQGSQFKDQRILLVEDDAELRSSLGTALREFSFEVDLAEDGLEAIRKIKQSVYDILLTDLRLPGLSGEEVLCQTRELYPDLIVIVVTGYGDVRNAVNMMKLGAADYIQKPFLKEELLLRIEKALEERRWRWHSRSLPQPSSNGEFVDLLGESPGMQQVKARVSQVASLRTTVLILGETGVGKELVARAIHNNSPRKDAPLVTVNCGAIPSNLMEDEFFGHEKGAFTDAQQLRLGRFEQANRGTIFLDEISNMPPELQGKLLRVLQERECQRVGGSQTIRLDIRILAATNTNLEERVQSGAFREDLFYRLNVFPIWIPPLRERKEDLPLLVPHLLQKICAREGIPLKQITQEAMKDLIRYDWPGNIRQLENALEMAIILAGEREYLLPGDLPALCHRPAETPLFPNIGIPPEGVDFHRLVSEFEKALITEGLKIAQGKRSKAATLLNLKRTTLLEKLRRLQPTPS
ncbi:MAG: sigma-54-dependent Fis family transcriptional regulator [Acidobacteria bacterium]|nr:sigma-54-dependent Fis family transcriptional regulator [Acidobacteriota bacterium]